MHTSLCGKGSKTYIKKVVLLTKPPATTNQATQPIRKSSHDMQQACKSKWRATLKSQIKIHFSALIAIPTNALANSARNREQIMITNPWIRKIKKNQGNNKNLQKKICLIEWFDIADRQYFASQNTELALKPTIADCIQPHLTSKDKQRINAQLYAHQNLKQTL